MKFIGGPWDGQVVHMMKKCPLTYFVPIKLSSTITMDLKGNIDIGDLKTHKYYLRNGSYIHESLIKDKT